MTRLVLTVDRMATGGEGVARDGDGRVVFVHGGLPGERVEAELTEQRKDFARATVTTVEVPSPDRVEPPCPEVRRGCGGCDWQHVAPAAQRALRVEIVRDALLRLGRIAEPIVAATVTAGPELPADRTRTTLRLAVSDGRLGFRRRRSHDVLTVDDCLVGDPSLTTMLADGVFDDAEEVTLRVGARTGERIAVVTPHARGVQLPADIRVVGLDELRAGRRVWFHEEVHGRRLRISAESFFQAGPIAAEALVDVVAEHAQGLPGGDGLLDAGRTVIDAYGGIGLFAAVLTHRGARSRFVIVESSASAAADARVNLAGSDPAPKVIRTLVERWHPQPADLVIADPPRAGLGKDAAHRLAGTGAARIVLVSCEPAALGRDARILEGLGYRFVRATTLDLFPQTSHIEVVSTFDRQAP
jgi:23S rRNA (uracil1939-C5)-methyltransferase